VPTKLLAVDYDPDGNHLFTIDRRRNKRINITGAKDVLNGYQQGKCFYCYQNISIEANSSDICHVDHYFPKTINDHEKVIRGIDTIWNLVLACRTCNSASEKWSSILPETHIEDLHERNEYLIASSRPLRQYIESLTGKKPDGRISFLKDIWQKAKREMIHEWQPNPMGPKPFRRPINKQ
jgi:5-methylcytosine-specific restriction endonuclease McrA